MGNPQIHSLLPQQSQHATIDQLCYTWSTMGYSSSLAAGFRIRAASPGLQAVNDDRVKRLDRYLRYNLPEGADRFEVQKNLEQAPVCLALIQLESGERILVHKKYIGQDGVNRLGSFFIHLLAGLPSDFSVKDAISLWRSSAFWLTSEADERLDNSIQLNPLSPTELSQYYQPIDVLHPLGIEASQRQLYLPVFICAYLIWRKRWEQWRQTVPSDEPPRLYIAAPPDMIAAFLYGLAICLPRQLLMDLTFSTYEDDVKKGQTLLIGTCWLLDADEKISSQCDLPPECYTRDIAINCYNGKKTVLGVALRKLSPVLDSHLLIDDFAADAMQCLLTKKLDMLDTLSLLEISSVNTFLQYYRSIRNADNPLKEDIELYFTQPTLAERIIRMESVKSAIKNFALQDKDWFEKHITQSVRAKLKGNTDFEELVRAIGLYLPDVPQPTILTIPQKDNINTCTLEQLWFTWSTISCDNSQVAGLHIRAASPGLQSVNSSRVRSLERYLRYKLPEGADRFEVQKNLEQAPICFALLQSESRGRILVRKKYVGKDSFNHLGNFFIHLLDGLPPDFSVKDAISLWNSPFWCTSDEGLGSSTQLNSISLTELLQHSLWPIDVLDLQGVERSWVENLFPHFLLAYLQWRERWEQWQQIMPSDRPPRLYIAAPPDMIAAFLYGLTIYLPWQLLTDLTFSTYEDDVRKSRALLVGTCWLPGPNGKIAPYCDLPAVCHKNGIVMNCYTYDTQNKQLGHDPLASRFASYATKCLFTGNLASMQAPLFNAITDKMHLDVRTFLQEVAQYV